MLGEVSIHIFGIPERSKIESDNSLEPMKKRATKTGKLLLQFLKIPEELIVNDVSKRF